MFELLAFILIGIWVWWALKPKSRPGRIYLDNKAFDYEIGNDIMAEWLLNSGKITKFNGINIILDKKLPHIYLDSHKDSRLSGPRFKISQKSKVSLEGNFDKYFQLYATDGYKQLALSIISPDVMQALIASAEKYDIEIKGDRLRLISQKKIFNKPVAEKEILDAAQVVLSEVNQRLKSWTVADERQSAESQLDVVYEQTFKFGHDSISVVWLLALFIGIIFAGSWLLMSSGAAHYNRISPVSSTVRLLGVALSFAGPLLLTWGLEYFRKHYPARYDALVRIVFRQ